jgi:putative ABC transport system permease protein
LSLRELVARPGRAVLTGTGAVIGVALVAGTLVLLDTANRTATTDDDVRQLGREVLVAGVLALVLGAFIINATVTVTVARRTRELALLRCLGADGRQIRRLVLAEAVVIGTLAALVGLAAGIGVAAGLRAYVNSDLFPSGELPGAGLVIAPRSVAIPVVLGVLALALSALAPARRAARVAPLAALRDAGNAARRGTGRGPAVAGALLVVLGAAGVPVAVHSGPGVMLLPAAVLTLLGVRLLGARLVAPLAGFVGLPLARCLPLSGARGARAGLDRRRCGRAAPAHTPYALAVANVVRNADRTAASVSALMIGLALVSFIVVLGASTRAAIEDEAARMPDLHVHREPGTGSPASIDAGTVAGLAALPELSAVAPIRYGEGAVAGRPDHLAAADPVAFARTQRLAVTAGRMADLRPGGLGVTDRIATARGWTVGTPVPVRLAGGERTLTVRVVYAGNRYLPGTPDHLMTPSDYAELGGDPVTGDVFMSVRDGVTPAEARRAVAGVLAADPTLVAEDRSAASDRYRGQITRSMSRFLALAGLAALVGVLGIVNTITLSIVDRFREIGLLRAIGMARRQIRAMVRAEAVIVSVVGAVLGIGLGTFFGWGAARVFEESSAPTRFTVPVVALLLLAAVAAGAGVLAAAAPARMAGRIDVLRAVAGGLRGPQGEASRAGLAGGLRGPQGEASRAGLAGD